ncbi:shikimate dehydrogenase [Actinomycetospora sp. NBRC 106378]|uniref:shikimate dehydrogenase n=1 Tax=Actinomycetospora sp. NBRC 106378 TaxID=3032208 RepID=UPI0024A581FE|nr:shikimate dehydrogenase [Actinomycetospora sp. NBRC 106378]GLZ52252.1 shikimate dehydrogenase [Actinomycetospora sp. NBRC 106378]
MAGPRRAAVLGSPVAHSLSPVLHAAAYEALGLHGWTYERRECTADDLPGLVGGLDAAWVGLSVTMPGKRAALAYATSASTRARRLGVANTLVRTDAGWSADCTDVDGIAGALRGAGIADPVGSQDVVVLGAGATASAAVGALDALGTGDVQLVVRDPARAAETTAVVDAYGMRGLVRTFDGLDEVDLSSTTALVNTTPAGAVDAVTADRLVDGLPAHAVVLDAIYHPWPTPLAAAAERRGLAVATGLDMLLHQAFGQVEQFTGCSAPRREMHAALVRATGFDVRPP